MRVVVAGVNYGAMYLLAVEASSSLELAGIISRGSQRSRSLADSHKVPLLLNVEEFPENVELACVAIGGMQESHAISPRCRQLLALQSSMVS